MDGPPSLSALSDKPRGPRGCRHGHGLPSPVIAAFRTSIQYRTRSKAQLALRFVFPVLWISVRVYSSRPDGIGWGAGSEMPSVHLRTAVGRAGCQPAPAPASLSTSGRARCCSGSFCHLGRIFPLEQEHDCRGPVTCHTLGLAEGPVVVSEASRSPRRRQDSV